jgi:hypothetical protein
MSDVYSMTTLQPTIEASTCAHLPIRQATNTHRSACCQDSITQKEAQKEPQALLVSAATASTFMGGARLLT